MSTPPSFQPPSSQPSSSEPSLSPVPFILHISPIFSLPQAIELKQSVEKLCQRPEIKHLILDFEQTTFMDSSGIGALISCRKHTEAQAIKLTLRRLSPQVRMALTMTELDQVFCIEENITDADPAQPSEIVTHPSVHSKAKRLLDVVGAIVGLGITAGIFLPVAIAIKLEDGGPILFSQTRCSWMGRPFRIWKFRSMVTDAEARKQEVQNQIEGALFKNDRDPRVTRIGNFLRRTSLDELPQFWNVLRGEMSLVGTRPPTLDEIEHYEIPQWRRLDIKPGMTGEWQVNGRSQVKNFEDVVQLDLKYQRNWSLWYDIRLIIKTIAVVFNKKSGAY
ncbi:MAG: STAS domain-containing protein [Synechococcales cyanobacterium RU_4_20]|nr:STAS domain-containing protein [Synechococcales cyanobacterium RU_4_20]